MTQPAAPLTGRHPFDAHASGRRHSAAVALAAPGGSASRRLVTNAAIVGGAALVAAASLIHLYLWADGYRHVPTIGRLFLAQGITGLLVAVGLIAWPRVALAVFGSGFLLATIAGFLISASSGLFGFMDTLDAPWAGTSLAVESAGALLLAIGALLPVGTA
jgi:hypothetical protein